MIVYEALYNPMVHESSARTISIHLSKEGAEKAIEAHKNEKYFDFIQMYSNEDELPFEFGTFESWFIAETEILP